MRDGTLLRRVGAWTGVVLMVVPLYLFAVSGLVAPVWAVVGLLVLWVLALSWAIKSRDRHPWFVLALPAALVGVWFAVLTVGGALLGWTA